MAKLYYNFCQRGLAASDLTFLYHAVMEQRSENMTWYQKFQQLNAAFSPHPSIALNFLPSPTNIITSGIATRFKAIWKGALLKSNKLTLLQSLKSEWGQEPYINALPLTLRQNLTRLRVSAHRLPIEIGRYERPKIPRERRFCRVCTAAGDPNKIGDEKHLLFSCLVSYNKRQSLDGELKSAINSKDVSSLFKLKGKSLTNLGVYVNFIYSEYMNMKV